jgi:hypothetical protein
MTLPTGIVQAVGQPASIRVGTVSSTSPLRVDVQGTEFRQLGYIGALPAVGDVVALIGQSSSVSSDPTSWLVLGKINAGG